MGISRVENNELPGAGISLEEYRRAWQEAKSVYSNHTILNEESKIQANHKIITVKGRKVLYIAFAGSWDFLDWIRNLLVYRGDNPFDDDHEGNARTHIGWTLGYKSIRDELINTIKELQFDDIMLVGHSAGAAACCLAAIDIVLQLGLEELNYPAIISFGGAAPGNKEFADLCDKYTKYHLRFVTLLDPIHLLPLGIRPLEIGFYQPGEYKQIIGIKSHGLDHYKF